MKFDIKNFMLGLIAGIISIILIQLLIGDINIETEFEFGFNSEKNYTLYLVKVSP
tara:strand:+ start:637 stop:801 length:165 start_codon:yes stop_codon:yes gene_type:complete